MIMNWAYIAGFFDGEGSICTVTRKASSISTVTVTLAQSNDRETPPQVLLDISAFLDERGIRHNLSGGSKYLRNTVMNDGREIKPNRAVFNLQIQNREGIVLFLTGIRPYARVKKVKCEDVLRYFLLFPSMRGKFSSKPQQDIDPVAVRADREAGMTLEAIAKKYGCAVGTILHRLDPEGSRQRMRNWRAKQKPSTEMNF